MYHELPGGQFWPGNSQNKFWPCLITGIWVELGHLKNAEASWLWLWYSIFCIDFLFDENAACGDLFSEQQRPIDEDL